MNLDDIMRDIQAMKEDLLVFERTYCIPTEVFYEFYIRGEDPPVFVSPLDWSEWAMTYEILCERLTMYTHRVEQLLQSTTITHVSELVEQAMHRKPVALAHEPVMLSPGSVVLTS
jgi:hypothetical protein